MNKEFCTPIDALGMKIGEVVAKPLAEVAKSLSESAKRQDELMTMLAGTVLDKVFIDETAFNLLVERVLGSIGQKHINKLAAETFKTLPFCAKDMLTVPEAAQYMNVSKAQIYKLMNDGKLPVYKPNGKISYFKRVDLDEYLKCTRTSTKEEINDAATSHCLRNKMPQK